MSTVAARPGETVFELNDRVFERVQLVQSIQDLVGAVTLAGAALRWLQLPQMQERMFGALGLAVSAAVTVAFGLELRALRNRSHPAGERNGWIEWLDLLVGAMLVLGVLHGWAERHKLFRPDLLVGVMMVVKSLVQPWAKRRFGARALLRMDDEGMQARLSRFRRFDLRWADLAGFELTERTAEFTTRAGKTHRLRLRRYGNRDDIRAALHAHIARSTALPHP